MPFSFDADPAIFTADPQDATLSIAVSSTPAVFVAQAQDVTLSSSVSSTPAIVAIFAVPPEPEPGGGTVHGGSVGMGMSLSFAL